MNSSNVTSKVGGSIPMRRLGWAGLAALAGCAACCAIPLLAAAGVGGGATAALAGLLWPGAEFVLGGFAFAAVLAVAALRARAMKRRSCGTSSSVGMSPAGAGCGCRPTDPGSAQIFATPPARMEEPIACTVDLKNTKLIEAGLEGYRKAFARLLATEPFPGGFRWRFRGEPGLDTELKALAAGEHECCRFMTFKITTDGPHIVWEVRAHDHAASFLEEYSRLPERLRTEPRPGHDIIAVKDLAKKAGLVFTSDGEDWVRR
jgi:hypothetical protein